MRPTIATIVEGDGEIEALPLLARRILHESERFDVDVSKPIRCSRSKILPFMPGSEPTVNANELQRYVLLARGNVNPHAGAILILLDSDGDCPRTLSQMILDKARGPADGLPVGVVLADREYETWFIASWEKVRPEGAACPDLSSDPDKVQNPKAAIGRLLPEGLRYSETTHQAKFSDRIDLDLATDRSRSFRKLRSSILNLAEAVRNPR